MVTTALREPWLSYGPIIIVFFSSCPPLIHLHFKVNNPNLFCLSSEESFSPDHIAHRLKELHCLLLSFQVEFRHQNKWPDFPKSMYWELIFYFWKFDPKCDNRCSWMQSSFENLAPKRILFKTQVWFSPFHHLSQKLGGQVGFAQWPEDQQIWPIPE